MMFLGLFLLNPGSAQAQECFLGEIKMFAGSYAPQNYAFCDGQLLSISSYTTLYAVIGSTYGGDGISTFAVPDLRSRVPIHEGQGPGLSRYLLGQRGGTETRTLGVGNLPPHSHQLNASNSTGTAGTPGGNFIAQSGDEDYNFTGSTNATMNGNSIGNTGSGQSFSIVQPYNTVNYIICIDGLWPPRP